MDARQRQAVYNWYHGIGYESNPDVTGNVISPRTFRYWSAITLDEYMQEVEDALSYLSFLTIKATQHDATYEDKKALAEYKQHYAIMYGQLDLLELDFF